MFLKRSTKLLPIFQNLNLRNLSAKCGLSNNDVILEWDDANNRGDKDIFPSLWLRDNCQCPSCYQPGGGRLVNLRDLDPEIRPKEAKMTGDEGGFLDILWPDRHRSRFKLSWLKARSFSAQNTERKLRNRGGGNQRDKIVHWDASTELPRYAVTQL